MRDMKRLSYILFTFALIMLLCPDVWSSQEVGSLVQLRGTATISRPPAIEPLLAKLKDSVELNDTVSTGDRSRAKLLFIDESILTLASNSTASIEKFIYSLKGQGASIFNLIEGTMRTVVGKTEFEVHTPTIVAAARGTVIEFTVGTKNGKSYTVVLCLEGTVTVRSADPSIPGEVVLKPGEMLIVFEGEPIPDPQPYEETFERGMLIEIDDVFVTPTVVLMPPIDQDPQESTPVKIDVQFPDEK
jgi:hypothetical protein